MERSAKYKVQENQLDNLDFKSQEFKDGVSELAKILKIPEHPNHLITLKAITRLIKTELCTSDKEERPTSSGDMTATEQGFTLDNCPLGFDVSDKQLQRPAKVLRMLYVNDLRDLQNKVNQIIVTVQSMTANPKTDSALGKIGR